MRRSRRPHGRQHPGGRRNRSWHRCRDRGELQLSDRVSPSTPAEAADELDALHRQRRRRRQTQRRRRPSQLRSGRRFARRAKSRPSTRQTAATQNVTAVMFAKSISAWWRPSCGDGCDDGGRGGHDVRGGASACDALPEAADDPDDRWRAARPRRRNAPPCRRSRPELCACWAADMAAAASAFAESAVACARSTDSLVAQPLSSRPAPNSATMMGPLRLGVMHEFPPERRWEVGA